MASPNPQTNPGWRVSELIQKSLQLVDQHRFKEAKQLLSDATELGYRFLGAGNELTLSAQAELALVYLYLEDASAALQNGREAFLMAQKHLGPRDEVTTILAYRLHFILMATSDLEECINFERENLHWLFTAHSADLTQKQLQVRQELDNLFNGTM
jgi:hypothetical protein